MENITNKFKKICEQKGFTLIELLGVIIILAVIALITYPIVDKSIQRSRESALERTIENIEGAAYNYSVEYDLGYPREQQILELKELANKGFISDKEHINPVTNNELEGCVLYRWNEATSQYYFKYAEPCVRTEIAPTMTLVYDKENINENDWLNKNIMVNINGTGTKYYYCIGNTECEPNIEENKTNGTKIIINEGTNVLCAKAENAYGESKVVCTEELNLDKTAPNIEGIGDKTVQRNTNVDLITGVTYNDALSGISGELIIEPTIVDTSVTGTKVVKYKITDKAGNTKEATRNIIVDAPAPTITYNLVDSSSINSNGWAKSNFFVRATITDNSGSGINIAKSCSSNSSSECTPSASFTSTTKDFYIQTEGNNRMCIEVTDNNNKTSKVCSDTYKLDKTLPTISGLTTQTVQRHSSVDLKTGVTYNDALSGISGELIIEPASVDTSVTGTKVIKYKVTDKAGNTKEATRSIIVDAPSPTITYTLADSSSVNGNGWAKSDFFVRATITDNSGSGIKSTKSCSSNSSDECTPSASFTGTTKDFYIQTEGNNKLCIEVTDNNNKTSKICSDTYKLDKTLPTISGLTTQTVQRHASVDLKTGVTYNDALSGISGDLIIEPTIVDTSVAGTKTVKYTIRDKAGNTKEATRSIIIDAPAPTITYNLVNSSSVNSNGWAKSNFFVRATITDNSGSGIKSTKSCSSNSSDECTPSATFTGTTKDFYIEVEGNNRLCIQVTDNNNKTSKICSDTYKLDKTAPTAGTATFTGTLGSNSWYTSNVTVNKVNGSDSLSGHSSTTSNISSITSNTSGTKVTITTTDLAGNSSTRNYTIKIDKNSPTITAKSGTVSITEGDSNATSNYFTVSYGISGGSLSCSPTNTSSLSSGTKTVTCTATGGNGKKVTATKQIEVKAKLYIDNSGANSPELLNNMIPIYYDGNNWEYADISKKWYDYNSQEWANAVVLNSGVTKNVGDTITEDEIALWYVWIPRYTYTIFNGNNEAIEPVEIQIKFESGTNSSGTVNCVDSLSGNGTSSEICTDKTNGSVKNGISTYTHPAFTFGTQELTGFWAGKFEVSGSTSKITIKPNITSLRNQTISSFFTAIQNMTTIYNLNGDSHMMKNMEWGAVTYLSYSKYGTCAGGKCVALECIPVNIYDDSHFITGGGPSNAYKTNVSQSTTGNIYGIYDMNGGAWDYVMGNMITTTGIFFQSLSGFSSIPNSKYYDSYTYNTSNLANLRGKLGDATREILKTFNNEKGSWYSDYTLFPYMTSAWFYRGCGLLGFSNSHGDANSTWSSRAVLVSN